MIAIVSYQIQKLHFEGLNEDEDEILIRFLNTKGIPVERVIWDDTTVDWTKYEVIIIKSPWDYHYKHEAFLSWLSQLDQLPCKVLNPTQLIRWNFHKKYLTEIAASGFDVIPSVILSGVIAHDLPDLFHKFNSSKIVLKPCISAGAYNTLVLTREMIAEKSEEINQLMNGMDYLVQPFIPQIEEGEWSLLFFGGQYSHGLIKLPAEGEFRVQHYYGGTFQRHTPNEDTLKTASELVNRFAPNSLYARVDGVMVGGRFWLMEIELIEPMLYMTVAPESFENYYSALVQIAGFKV